MGGGQARGWKLMTTGSVYVLKSAFSSNPVPIKKCIPESLELENSKRMKLLEFLIFSFIIKARVVK